MGGSTHSPGARAVAGTAGGPASGGSARARLGLGVERDVDVGVVGSSGVGTSEASSSGTGRRREPARPAPPRSRLVVLGHHDERLAAPERGGRCDRTADRGGARRAAGRRDRDARGDEERDEDDGDEQHGRAGRAESRVQRAAHHGAEIAAGVLAARSSSRTTACAWRARPGRTRRAARARCRRRGATGRRPRPGRLARRRPRRRAPAVDEQARRRRRPRGAAGGRGPNRPAARRRCRCRCRRARAGGPTAASASRMPSVIERRRPTGRAPARARTAAAPACGRGPAGPGGRLLGGGARRAHTCAWRCLRGSWSPQYGRDYRLTWSF